MRITATAKDLYLQLHCITTELNARGGGVKIQENKVDKVEACIGYFGIWDIGLFLRDIGIFVFFILGYGIFDSQRFDFNFGI